MEKVARNRKRHRSDTNCKRCPSVSDFPPRANFFPSFDDCMPSFLSGSTFSNCDSTSGSEAPRGGWCSSSNTLNYSFCSSPFVPVSSSSLTTYPCFPNCDTPSSSNCSSTFVPESFSFVNSSSRCSTTFSSRSSSFASSSSVLSNKCNLRLSICSSSDDEIASSPDSGFESAASNGSSSIDYFDNFKHDNSINTLSTSPPLSKSPQNRLCLFPPSKPETPQVEPKIICQWRDCSLSFSSYCTLHDHLCTAHINSSDKRICCLWHECRVYDKPARTMKWLRAHVSTHTREKRFKCILDGCGASFSSQQGLARHVPSHFNEVNLPKARLAVHAERKCLVKRRKIKDEKKALANIHDVMDQRSLDMIVNSLVKHTEKSISSPSSQNGQVICTRRCSDGSVWNLSCDHNAKWSRTALCDGVLFFGRPPRRSRKFKMK